MALQLQGRWTAATSQSRYGGSSTTRYSNVEGDSGSSSSESSSTERTSNGSSDIESVDSGSTKWGEGLTNGESSSTGSRKSSRWRNGSISVERKVAEGSMSSVWRCMQHSQHGTVYMPVLGTVAVIRDILQKFREGVEANLEQLKKQFLLRHPFADSVRLDLLRRVKRAVRVANELDRRSRRYYTGAAAVRAADTPTGTPQRINTTVTQRTAVDASPVDEQLVAQSRSSTGPPLSAEVRQDRLATHHVAAASLEGIRRDNTEAVPEQKNTSDRSRSHVPARDGENRNRGTAETGGESHERSHSRPQQPAARGNCVDPYRLLVSTAADEDDATDEEDEGFNPDGYASDNYGYFESTAHDRLRASDFIDGFRLMLQPAHDDPFERYVRIRRPDSAVLRLLDYYQQHADVYEAWDWERDPLLVGSSGVRYPQTPAFDVKDMLRDAVALYEQLFILNINNTRVLTEVQDQLAEAWTDADPAIKEADRLFVKSVGAVAEALYTQKRIDDWNLTVLADRALGSREKYLVYDPATGRLRLLRDAYMADIIPEEIDCEKLTRKLNRKIAALFLNAGRRHRSRTHTRRKSPLRNREPEKGRKGPMPSAAVPSGTPPPVGARGASVATSDLSQRAKKIYPDVGVAACAAAPVSQAAPVPSPKVWPSTAVAVVKQKMIPKFQLRADDEQLEKSGKRLLQSAKLQQSKRPTAPTLPLKRPDAVAGPVRGSPISSAGAAPALHAAATTVEAVDVPAVSPRESLLPSPEAAAPKHDDQAFVDSSAQATLLRSPGLRKGSRNSILTARAQPAALLQSTAKAGSASVGPLAARPATTEVLSKTPGTSQHDLTPKPSPDAQLDFKILFSSEVKQQKLVLPATKQQQKLSVLPTHSVVGTKSVISPLSPASALSPHITKNDAAAGGKASPTAVSMKTTLATSSSSGNTAAPFALLTSKVASLSGGAATAAPPFSETIRAGGEPKISGKPMQLRKRLPLPPPKTQPHSKFHPNEVLKKTL